jgi:hypothetical protein
MKDCECVSTRVLANQETTHTHMIATLQLRLKLFFALRKYVSSLKEQVRLHVFQYRSLGLRWLGQFFAWST